uniref:DUF5641 domain-containing protein n=1 Tax=Haemonchus placei TaxID=6290 RepID=A0A0N4WNL6_HAEPC
LREQHKTQLSKNRINSTIPQERAVVLASDPILTWNEWKLARITT